MQAPGLRRASAGVLAVWLALLCMVTGVVEADQSAFLCSADSGATFMRCLNQTADLNVPVVLTIEGDIYLKPEDWEPYAAWLPIHSGNSTVTVSGPPLLHGSGFATPILDLGGALALSFHSAGVTWVMQDLQLQGMATHSAGYAATGPQGTAALGYEMVNGVLWPSTVGQPGHLMVFRNMTLVQPPGTPCSANDTQFRVASLRREAGRDAGIDMLSNGSYIVRQPFDGSFPLRDIATGSSVGNVRYSLSNVTFTCSSEPAAIQTTAESIPLAADSGSVIAGSCGELAYYLGVGSVTDIEMAGPIKLSPACLANFSLPIVVARGRNVTLRSNDGQLRVLDFGQTPQLLELEDTASLTFKNMELQGMAFPSAVYQNRSVMLDGSPVWPTIDGQPGHVMAFDDCYIHEVETPCSTKSTQLEIDLLQRALGSDGVQRVGDTIYTILKPTNRMIYFRDLVTQQQLYHTQYTFNDTTISCLEDPGVALAPELLGSRGDNVAAAGGGGPDTAAGSSGGGSSSSNTATIVGAVVGAVAGCALVAAVVLILVVRRRRRQQRVQLSTQASKMDSMESGELPSSVIPLVAKDAAGTLAPLDSSANASTAAKNALWRSKFGLIDGLEVGELLGRGSYGRVYKGRWNGALVAIKVVEHRVVGGKAYDLSREPLLSLSVSHPNCITTYKLSVVRVLTEGEEHSLSRPSSELVLESEPQSGESSLVGATSEPLSPEDALKAAAAAMETAAAAGGTQQPRPPAAPFKPAPSKAVSRSNSGAKAAAQSGDSGVVEVLPASGSGAVGGGAAVGSGGSGGGAVGSGGSSRQAPSGKPPRPAAADSAATNSSESRRTPSGRRLQSLLSGAAAIEVCSTNEVLLPGLYETWIICEYCDQKTLQDAIAGGRIRQQGNPRQPDLMAAYLCLLDIALGMEYLHNDLNILHGDLKPANVLLKGARNDRRGFVCKLADFGLSRLLGAQDTGVDTSSCGTPSHAAPEVLSQSRMTKHGDVYAFGIIAWELVAREDPYPHMLAVQIILQVVQHGYRPPRPDGCPDSLWALMQRCWATKPHDRPPFSEVVGELKVQITELRRGNAAQAQTPQRVSGDSAMDGKRGSGPSSAEQTASS